MHLIKAPPVALTGLLLLSISSLASASAAVLGIDFGQEYIKAALVKPGIPLEIVLTKDTKRKEASAIGFKPAIGATGDGGEYAYPERLYGVDAVNLAARFPHDVYPGLKAIMGRHILDDSVTAYSGRNPSVSIVPDVLRNTVSFQSPSAPSAAAAGFTVEELLAMQFKSIVYNAEVLAGAGTRIRDVVFTVPAFLGAEGRNSLRLAAELAGLRVMSFVSDGLAVGINYATTRTFNESSPEYHIVYDMGAGSTTATVLKFRGKSVKDFGRFNKTVQEVTVLGIGYDTELGGDLFNKKVFEILLDDFVNSPKAKKLLEEDTDLKNTVRTNGRAASKLWKEATRIRQILSANTDTIASIESLYKDIDFRSGKVTRAAFEELIAEYEARITKPITDAISNANIPLGEVNTLIVHGGAFRTPFVGKKIEDIMGGAEKISKQVNPDESAVLGATFKGAAESGAFKVKEIRTQDVSVFGVSIKYKKDEEAMKETAQQIFPFYSKLGNEKVIPFSRNSEFTFRTLYNLPPRINDPNQRPGQELLNTIQTTNLTESFKKLRDDFGCAEKDIVTKFGIVLSPRDSLPKVVRSWIECEVEVVPDAPQKDAGGAFEDVKGFFGYGKKKDSEQQVLKDEDSGSPSSTSTKSSSTSSSAASKETKSSDSEPKTIRRTEKIPVKYTITKDGFPSISEKDKTGLILKIRGFDKHDKDRKNLEEARNNLEAYTYRARGYLSDGAFIAVSNEEQREKLDAIITEASDWLYGDGYTASLKQVQAKIKELEALETPISKRKAEKDLLPEALKELNNVLSSIEGFVEREESLAEAQAEGDHYPLDLAPLKEAHGKSKAWVEEKGAAQENLQPYENPVITSEEVVEKAKDLTMQLITVIHSKQALDDQRERAQKKAAVAAEKAAKEAEAKAKAQAEAVQESAREDEAKADDETEVENDTRAEDREEPYTEEKIEKKTRDEL